MDSQQPSGQAATLHDGRSPSPARERVSSGSRLGRYIVLEHLGSGGMGTVFAAWDPQLDRKLALKLLPPRDDDDDSIASLLSEARAIAGLAHPNIVKLHDVDTHAGRPFLAMEFVEGDTLRAWQAEARPDWETILARYCDAGAGLAAAHAAGFVHRDFKPENVMLGVDGRVRVLDFGLARRDGEADPAQSATAVAMRANSLIGTPDYMSPEQIGGAPLDTRSDQFSFCVALWEALCAAHPFPATSRAARLSAVCRGEHAPFANRRVPTTIARALARGLSVDPRARWPDMPALLEALSVRPHRRRQQRFAALTALSLALLATGVQLGRRGAQAVDCETRARVLDTTWDSEAHAAFERSFASFSTPTDASNLAEVRGYLDAWTLRWSQLVTNNCTSYHHQHRQSAELFDLRAACLDESLASFAAFLTLLEDTPTSPLQVLTALEHGELLPKLGRCEDAETLRGAALPLEPARAAEFAALSRQVERGSQLNQLSRFADAVAALEPLAARVEALDHPPLTAFYMYALSLARLPLGSSTADDAIQALAAAARANEEGSASMSALVLARQALMRGDASESKRWLAFAGSAGHPGSGVVELELVKAKGFLALSQDRPLEALEAFERSVAAARTLSPNTRSVTVAQELSNYGYAASQLAWLRPQLAELALEAQSEALSIARERMQPAAYSLLSIRLNLALALARSGRVEHAHTMLEHTGTQIIEHYGDQVPLYEAYLRRRHILASLDDDCTRASEAAGAQLAWIRAHRPHDPTALAKSLLRASTRCELTAAQVLPLLDEAVALQWPEGETPVHPATAVATRLTRALHRLRAPAPAQALSDAADDIEQARATHDDSMVLLDTRLRAAQLALELRRAQPDSPAYTAARAALQALQTRLDPMLDADLGRLLRALLEPPA